MVECTSRSDILKKTFIGLLSCLLIGLLAACSTNANSDEATYSVQKEKVMITDDRFLIGATGVRNEKGGWEDILPKALYYEFTLKQDDEQANYKHDKDEVRGSILPDKDLKQASIDVLGVNIFEKNQDTYGYRCSIKGFDDSKTGKVTLQYYVGAEVKNNKMPLAPSDEELQKLKNVANHATLVLTRDDKEIGRYSLETLKETK